MRNDIKSCILLFYIETVKDSTIPFNNFKRFKLINEEIK